MILCVWASSNLLRYLRRKQSTLDEGLYMECWSDESFPDHVGAVNAACSVMLQEIEPADEPA